MNFGHFGFPFMFGNNYFGRATSPPIPGQHYTPFPGPSRRARCDRCHHDPCSCQRRTPRYSSQENEGGYSPRVPGARLGFGLEIDYPFGGHRGNRSGSSNEIFDVYDDNSYRPRDPPVSFRNISPVPNWRPPPPCVFSNLGQYVPPFNPNPQNRTPIVIRQPKPRLFKAPKRLSNAYGRERHRWRLDQKWNLVGNETKRKSKRRLWERFGLKQPVKRECEWWMCQRRQINRKRPFRTLDKFRKSPSVLSPRSPRDRSPIVFFRSP